MRIQDKGSNMKNSEQFRNIRDYYKKDLATLRSKLPLPSNLKSQSTRTASITIPFDKLETPSFLIDYNLLEDNLKYLKSLAEALNINIILAQKAYSLFDSYPLIGRYLKGTTSSGLYEARLADKHMPGKEIHVFSAAFKYEELKDLYNRADYIIFNSMSQLDLYRQLLKNEKGLDPQVAPKIGLRLNPEKSTGETEIYDPASKGSRLGITLSSLLDSSGQDMSQAELANYLFNNSDSRAVISGFHIHTLCEQNSDALALVLEAAIDKFSFLFEKATWINLGGGHHFTNKDYNIELFAELVLSFQNLFKGINLYFEPGEAVVLDCAWLVSEVQDIVKNGDEIAILDASAECHCPDILEMPYRPRAFLLDNRYINEDNQLKVDIDNNISKSEQDYELSPEDIDENINSSQFRYRLGGPSCLAGDYFGYYCFKRKLQKNDRIIFCDMALYSFVKSNHFNGMIHPDIYTLSQDKINLVKKYDFSDFEAHLGTPKD